jgi:hypothetical protein
MTHPSKVTPSHLQRAAYVYVRQSTFQQVLKNKESRARQYDFQTRALELGWRPEQVTVIDEDLAESAGTSTQRSGFQRLVADIGLGKVGLILGLEVSRLARNCSDWYRLLEICGPTATLVGDEDGIYDPNCYNDRLLLGLNRPGTQNTPYSTFWRSRRIQTLFRFRCTPRLAFSHCIPPANIPHVLAGIVPTKGGAQPSTI